MLNKIIELLKKNSEVIAYLFFGALTTAVNWIVYTVFVEIIEFSLTASNAMAWLVAVLFAFVTNKLYVFNSNEKNLTVILREAFFFFGSRFLSGLIEIFLPGILFEYGMSQSVFGIKGFASKVLVSIIVIVLNYIFSKFFVFNAVGKENLK